MSTKQEKLKQKEDTASILEAVTKNARDVAIIMETNQVMQKSMQILIDQQKKLDERLVNLEIPERIKPVIVLEETPKIADGLDDQDISFFSSKDNTPEPNSAFKVKTERASSDPVTAIMDFSPPVNKILATSPDYKHIYLKSLEAKPCLKFLKDAKQFMLQHGVLIRLAYQLSERNAHLLARTNDITIDSFRLLTNAACEKLLRAHVQPKSAVEFLDLMKTIRFTIVDDIKLTHVSYEQIYTSFLVYSSAYRELYEFLNNGQRDELIPPIDFRKKGLIYFYLQSLPKTFVDVFMNIVHREGFLISRPSPSFLQFVNKFEGIVKDRGYAPFINYRPIDVICKQFNEDVDHLKKGPFTRDSMLALNNVPIKKDVKLPCFRYFLDKTCPDHKANKCKYDHGIEAIKSCQLRSNPTGQIFPTFSPEDCTILKIQNL